MNDMSSQFPPRGETLAEQMKILIDDMLKYRLDIEAALEYANNSHTFDDVVGQVLAGQLHFYALPTSFVIMERQTYPQHKVYHCFLAGGHKAEIEDAQPMLMKNAKHLECKYVTVVGRNGWVRELRKQGWKHQYSVLSKEVT